MQFTRFGAKVVFVTMPPPPTEHDIRVEYLNVVLKQFVATHPDTTAIIDLATMACPPAGKPPCPTVVDGVLLRPDFVHFSPAGAQWVANRISPVL